MHTPEQSQIHRKRWRSLQRGTPRQRPDFIRPSTTAIRSGRFGIIERHDPGAPPPPSHIFVRIPPIRARVGSTQRPVREIDGMAVVHAGRAAAGLPAAYKGWDHFPIRRIHHDQPTHFKSASSKVKPKPMPSTISPRKLLPTLAPSRAGSSWPPSWNRRRRKWFRPAGRQARSILRIRFWRHGQGCRQPRLLQAAPVRKRSPMRPRNPSKPRTRPSGMCRARALRGVNPPHARTSSRNYRPGTAR